MEVVSALLNVVFVREPGAAANAGKRTRKWLLMSYLILFYYAFSVGMRKCLASNVNWYLCAKPAVVSLQST